MNAEPSNTLPNEGLVSYFSQFKNQDRAAWNGRVIKSHNALDDDFRLAYFEMCEAIKAAASLGFLTWSVRFVNEVNEITPTNIDRDQFFFRAVFRKTQYDKLP